MSSKTASKKKDNKQVDRRICIRFGARDQELFDFLYFGQPEELSRYIKRALYAYTGLPGGDYLGQPTASGRFQRPVNADQSLDNPQNRAALDKFFEALAALGGQ